MFNSVIGLLDDSAAIIATIPALPVALTALRAQTAAIPALATAQAQPTTGVTADKQATLDTMIEAALAVGASALSYASQHHLGDLAAKVRVSSSIFGNARELDRLTLAQQVHDAAAGVVAQLADFGATSADLADLQAKIDAARAALTAPRAAAGAKKSATQQLADAFHTGDDILNNQLDPLAAKFAKKNPDFYAKYQAARIIVDRPGGHASPASSNHPPTPPAAPVK